MKYNFYLQYVLRNCVDNAEKPFLIYDNGNIGVQGVQTR